MEGGFVASASAAIRLTATSQFATAICPCWPSCFVDPLTPALVLARYCLRNSRPDCTSPGDVIWRSRIPLYSHWSCSSQARSVPRAKLPSHVLIDLHCRRRPTHRNAMFRLRCAFICFPLRSMLQQTRTRQHRNQGAFLPALTGRQRFSADRLIQWLIRIQDAWRLPILLRGGCQLQSKRAVQHTTTPWSRSPANSRSPHSCLTP